MRAKTCFSSLWQMFCWWYYFFSRLPFQELGKPRVKFACALYVCSYIDNFLLIVVILLANVYWRCWWYLLFCACWLFLDSGKQRVKRACLLLHYQHFCWLLWYLLQMFIEDVDGICCFVLFGSFLTQESRESNARVPCLCALLAAGTAKRHLHLPHASSRRLVQLLSLCCAASVIS